MNLSPTRRETNVTSNDRSVRPTHEPDAPRDLAAYAAPSLIELGHVDDLLEVLGPAQASYGDMGP